MSEKTFSLLYCVRKSEGRDSACTTKDNSLNVSPAGGVNTDDVGPLQLSSSVQRNATPRPKTVAVQLQPGSASRRPRVPLDFAAVPSTDDAFLKSSDDALQLPPPPSPSYYDVVLADCGDDSQRSGAAGRISRHRRVADEDSDVLERLLPSSATVDRSTHSMSVTLGLTDYRTIG